MGEPSAAASDEAIAAPIDPLDPAERARWDERIREHDRAVVVSLLARGVRLDRARDLAQAAWTRLIERAGGGQLGEVRLPGLAIAQARFLALDDLRRRAVERRLAPDAPVALALDPERALLDREALARTIAALAGCPATARRVFHLIHGTPPATAADAAAVTGLSVQRVRQIVCEVRKVLRDAIEERP